MRNSHHIGDHPVNHMVTDHRPQFDDNAQMVAAGKFPNYLAAHLERAGMRPAHLARRAGIDRQLVAKFTSGRQRLTKEWAERLAPFLHLSWQELLDAPRSELSERTEFLSLQQPSSELDCLPAVTEALQNLLEMRGVVLSPRRLTRTAMRVLERTSALGRLLPFDERLELTLSEMASEIDRTLG